eukprot:s539_g17.t1
MVSQLQVKWLESKEKKILRQQAPSTLPTESKRVWSARAAATDVDPDRRVSKKARREQENTRAIGGMRNLFSSISRRRLPRLDGTSRGLGGGLERGVKVAAQGEGGEYHQLERNIEFVSPLGPAMWRAWQRASADPENRLADWAKTGAPLGMGKEIPSSGGVFPEVDVVGDGASDMPALEWQAKIKNYTSMFEDPEGRRQRRPGHRDRGGRLSDAYCHFPVAKEELGNCLAPGLDEHEIIVFCAMLFGFLAAPLVMGRPSSALARLWQSMIMRDGSLQLYMDDPLFGVLGPANRRKGIIAMLLYTALAMGINLAFHKGERGLMVKWIGVAMELNVREASFVLSVPKKVSVEILEKMRVWKGGRDKRYGDGKGYAQRRSKAEVRTRTVVPVKRFELARAWLEAMFEAAPQWLTRSEELEEESPEFMIVTDASPEGLGAVLAHVEPGTQFFEPIAALAIKVTEKDARELGLEWGKSSSQGPLEAAAVAVAINTWADKLRGGPVLLESDSVKLSSGSPAMNCIGAYLAFFGEMANIDSWVTMCRGLERGGGLAISSHQASRHTHAE